MKTALVFGVTGQDGSYLAEFLLRKNYRVYGVARRVSTGGGNLQRVSHIVDENFSILEGDVTDAHSVNAIMSISQPDEVYNLAAQSHVRTSFDQPVYTWNATACGALNVLEAIRQVTPDARYYQAGSSEMFGASLGRRILDDNEIQIVGEKMVSTVKLIGQTQEDSVTRYKQDESTPFVPCSPYGVAKLAAHHLTKIYRDGYKLFACNGILFNHESPRRCDTFLSKKVTQYVAKLFVQAHSHPEHSYPDVTLWDREMYDDVLKNITPLKLGNLSAYRDWGWAPDFVRAMWLMLQQDKPDDYVIATGESHTVKEFVVAAFEEGLGYYSDRFVQTDPKLYRAVEVNYLCGDYSKAQEQLGWKPQTNFKEIVRKMVVSDIIEQCMTARLPEEEYKFLNDGGDDDKQLP